MRRSQAAAIGDWLTAFTLFDALDLCERQALAQQAKWCRVPAGRDVLASESDSRDVFFVAEGLVRVVPHCRSGREISFEDIGPGGFFGELAAIDGHPRSASVVAVETSLIASLPDGHFVSLVTSHPEVALTLMRRLAAMVRKESKRVVEVSTLSAQNRINIELLRLAAGNRTDCYGARIRPLPSHGEIASRVSVSRETVTRSLNVLERQGLVRRERGALVIPNVARLAVEVNSAQ